MKAESVDCVITDPPYFGFEFGLEVSIPEYWKTFLPYYEEMFRLCKGPEKHLAISQPANRHEYIRAKLPPTRVLRIEEAFTDNRGASADFLMINPLLDDTPESENWSSEIVPVSIHENDRDINKMSIIVKAMTKEGDTVFDPFCGSAAIGVACVLLGRKYIGIELIPPRAKDAEARLAAAVRAL